MAQGDTLETYILCAGEGSRLFPFTSVLPKCLMPIGGKPCATIILEIIQSSRVNEQIGSVVICYRTKEANSFLHEFTGKGVTFMPDDGVTTASHFKSHPPKTDHFAIWYGDCLVNLDLYSMFQSHLQEDNDATLIVTRKARLEFGRVKLRGGGRKTMLKVKGIEEKPYINTAIWTGVAIMKTKSVMPFIEETSDFAKDVFPDLVKAGLRVGAIKLDREWFDIGSYSAYKQVNEMAERGEFFWPVVKEK